MRFLATLALMLIAGAALACDLAVSTPSPELNVTVDNMRHGTRNELTLFLTLRNQGKAPIKLAGATGLDVLDDQGRRVAPSRVDGAVTELAAGQSAKVVSHYLPSPDYTATRLDLK
ncbi:DUF4232 domain-containing protein [Chitiniphilus purpureus]|uniref:DUF4232 domain-containing protein n=1 Tax=Chitiniphilus purpureus TaxID=2981137 RepID=A0ABY6DLF8_9NEIS|nr:DUF4232 domain-containing protein [Chitiniphilus sp. CD1]UXY15204.1 DUF4232 domain-containing protein [Chitiniphilus sp. CD1]